MIPTVETIDIYELLFAYVRKYPFKEKLRKKIDFDKLDASSVVTAKFRMRNQPTVYEEVPSGEESKKPKTSIIFSSSFENSTSNEQMNNLRTEKRTVATCRLQLTKVVTRSGSISLQIAPPSTMVQVNGSFSKEKTVTSDKEEVMEEEVNWTLDTQVVIPPGTRTRADFVITEGLFMGRFKVDTIFEGKLSVILRDKRKKPVTMLNIDDLRAFLKPELGFKPVPEGQAGAVIYTNEGMCHCSFGIEQHVELHEEKLQA